MVFKWWCFSYTLYLKCFLLNHSQAILVVFFKYKTTEQSSILFLKKTKRKDQCHLRINTGQSVDTYPTCVPSILLSTKTVPLKLPKGALEKWLRLTGLWCSAREQQVGEKVSYLVTSCQGGGRREFTMMPWNSQHANVLNIEAAHKILGQLICGCPQTLEACF